MELGDQQGFSIVQDQLMYFVVGMDLPLFDRSPYERQSSDCHYSWDQVLKIMTQCCPIFRDTDEPPALYISCRMRIGTIANQSDNMTNENLAK